MQHVHDRRSPPNSERLTVAISVYLTCMIPSHKATVEGASQRFFLLRVGAVPASDNVAPVPQRISTGA